MRRILSYILLCFCLSGVLACSYARFFDGSAMSPPSSEWQRFLKAYAIIKTHYYKPVADEKLIDDAINGMLQGLDPHSMYLDKKDLSMITQLTTGKFSGIGIEVLPEVDNLKVITPLDGSPAQKAGLLPGDEIIAIDDTSVEALSFREAIEALRGPANSSVKLTMARAGMDKPFTVTVTRRDITPQNIKSRLIKPNMGYVRISTFQKNTPQETAATINQLTQTNHGPLKSLILDLRNNPGGILQSATGVADLFLDYKTLGKNHLIVYSKNRQGEIVYSAKADDADILNNIPMIILINKGSASGSEIVAGALRDHHRAKLVGMRTFGKGSVQTVIPLGEDAIKLTTALYYTPDGKLIDHIGIAPDVEVKMVPYSKPDVQLERAVKLMSSP
ncbi:MAG TPA: S41 family peptidase [Gammaproteobacteria bacterium]|nr:S41 family peptidase [Gammaproteobacteria bacterium]